MNTQIYKYNSAPHTRTQVNYYAIQEEKEAFDARKQVQDKWDSRIEAKISRKEKNMQNKEKRDKLRHRDRKEKSFY